MLIRMIFRKFILLVAGFMITLCLGATGITISPEAIDLGKLKQHEKITSSVTLTNTSDKPVEILRIMSDCSCTAALPKELHLAPGASTTIDVTTETRAFHGDIRRRITVQTTAGQIAFSVRMRVSAFEDWSVSPMPVIMPPSQKDQESRLTIGISYLGEDQVKAVEAKSNLPWIEATLAPGAAAGHYLLHLHKPANNAPSGNLSVIVIVKTSDPQQSLLSIPVFIPVLSGVVAAPNPIILPTVKVRQESKGYFRLTGWEGKAAPTAKLALGTAKPIGHNNGQYNFEVAVTPQRPGSMTQIVQIYDGGKLELEIPLVLRALADDTAGIKVKRVESP